MSLDPEFLTMFSEEIQVEPCIGYNNRSEPVYGAPYQVPARVSGKALALRRPEGSDKTPIFDIWAILDGRSIGHDDRLSVVGDHPYWSDNGRLVLFAIGHLTDEHGYSHSKLQCGWQYHRQGQ